MLRLIRSSRLSIIIEDLWFLLYFIKSYRTGKGEGYVADKKPLPTSEACSFTLWVRPCSYGGLHRPSVARVYLADNLVSPCTSTIFHLFPMPWHFLLCGKHLQAPDSTLCPPPHFLYSFLGVWKSEQKKKKKKAQLEASLLKWGLCTSSCKGEPKENQGASQMTCRRKGVRKEVWVSPRRGPGRYTAIIFKLQELLYKVEFVNPCRAWIWFVYLWF